MHNFKLHFYFSTTNNSISDDSGVPISSSNLNGKMSSNSNSLTNVMTTCDTKPPVTGNMSGEEYHPLNGCKSLNGISSLVGEVLKQGSNNANNEQQQQQSSNKSLGINGTEISPSWKNFAVSNLANNNNMTNNNISNSSGENSTTSLNEMGRVSKTTFILGEVICTSVSI